MLITQNLKLSRTLKYTWKVHLGLALTCAMVFLVHEQIISVSLHIPPTFVTLLGTALAFFVGFNNNQSYARWWEARTVWGTLVNDSRNWARSITTYVSGGDLEQETIDSFRKELVRRQIAFVYALKGALRKKDENSFRRYLNSTDLASVEGSTHIPNAILTLNAKDLYTLLKSGSIDQFRFVQLDNLLHGFTDQMGKSERIRNTVFPASYIYFTRVFIWVLVIFLTLSLADSMGPWSILIGWIIGAVYHITHMNGMGLVNPFDEIPTGVPLDQISRTIEINLLESLGVKNLPAHVLPINNEYIL